MCHSRQVPSFFPLIVNSLEKEKKTLFNHFNERVTLLIRQIHRQNYCFSLLGRLNDPTWDSEIQAPICYSAPGGPCPVQKGVVGAVAGFLRDWPGSTGPELSRPSPGPTPVCSEARGLPWGRLHLAERTSCRSQNLFPDCFKKLPRGFVFSCLFVLLFFLY